MYGLQSDLLSTVFNLTVHLVQIACNTYGSIRGTDMNTNELLRSGVMTMTSGNEFQGALKAGGRRGKEKKNHLPFT